MKRLLVGTTAVAALVTTPALAAPPAPPAWTGFYAGGTIGYSWGNGDTTYSEPGIAIYASGNPPTSFSASQRLDGVIGGPEIGYNWQVNSVTVVGLEADFQWSGERGGASFGTACWYVDTDCEGPLNGTLNSNISWFGTVRARAGTLVTPDLFAYVTGGVAYGKISTSGSFTGTNIPNDSTFTTPFSSSTTKVGGTVGGGIEGAVPAMSEWTWKIEYLFVDFGNVGGSGYDYFFEAPFTWNVKVTDNILRVGLNRKFP